MSGDTQHRLQRLSATEPTVLWSSPIGETFLPPLVDQTDLFLATAAGRVLALDRETGQASWGVQLPQPVLHTPALDSRSGKLFMVGDHEHLYVLDRETGQCPETFYLGHETGTVVAPPAVIVSDDGTYLLVFDNAQPTYTLVHVLKTDAQGEGLVQAQPPIRLHGNVTVAALPYGEGRVVVLTDHGQVTVFSLTGASLPDPPIAAATQVVAAYDSPQELQMALSGDQLWVTGPRISRFLLSPQGGRASRDWVQFEGDRFVDAPQVLGDALFHTRALRNTAGIRVTAVAPENGQMHWQSDVGVPVSLIAPAPQAGTLHIVTAQAALFELDAAALEAVSSSAPIENPGGSGVAMNFELAQMAGPHTAVLLNRATGTQLTVYDGKRDKQKLRLITMPAPKGMPAGNGSLVGGRLLLPLDSGDVSLINWQTGQPVGQPFQPRKTAVTAPITWSTPVVLPQADGQVILADDQLMLYRLGVDAAIRLRALQPLETPLRPAMVVLQETLFAAAESTDTDRLRTFHTETLDAVTSYPLPGRVSWGPYSVNDSLLMRLDDGPLVAYSQQGQPLFDVALPAGKLIDGVTLANGGQVIVCGEAGWMVAFAADSGRASETVDLKQPLSGLPVVVGDQLLIPGREGTVYVTPLP